MNGITDSRQATSKCVIPSTLISASQNTTDVLAARRMYQCNVDHGCKTRLKSHTAYSVVDSWLLPSPEPPDAKSKNQIDLAQLSVRVFAYISMFYLTHNCSGTIYHRL
jgi:hypothetical protein